MATQAQINTLTGLYVSYFGRSPDPEGLQFWIKQVDSGRDITTIAQDFAQSNEAKSLYPYLANPSSSSPLDFISSIYQNLFNRAPEAAGLGFWYDALTTGAVSVGDMIEAILLGARGSDATIVENKIEVAFHWTISVPEKKGGFTFDAEAMAAAKTVLDDIDQWQASVARAKEQTEVYVAGVVDVPEPLPVLATPQILYLSYEQGEVLEGGAAGDTFIAAPGTLQDGDVLNGKGGNDVLKLTVGVNLDGIEGGPLIAMAEAPPNLEIVPDLLDRGYTNRLNFDQFSISSIETAEIHLSPFFMGSQYFSLWNLPFETVEITGGGHLINLPPYELIDTAPYPYYVEPSYADIDTAVAATIDASGFNGRVYLSGSDEEDTLIGTDYVQPGYTDTLVGRGGADTMTGGEGADIFLFTEASDSNSANADIILDFDAEEDVLGFYSIVNYLGEAEGYAAVLEKLQLSETTPTEDRSHMMHFNAVLDAEENVLYVDVNGDRALDDNDMEINLAGIEALTADNFYWYD